MTRFKFHGLLFRFAAKRPLACAGFIFACSSFTSCGPKEFDTTTTPIKKTTPGDEPSSEDQEGKVKKPGSQEKTIELTTCGFDANAASGLEISSRLSMAPIKKTVQVVIIPGVVSSSKEVVLSSSMVIESSLSSHVMSFGSVAAPVVQNDEIQNFIDTTKSGYDAKIIDTTTRQKLGEAFPEWSGVFCTLQPASRVITTRAGRLTMEFSQPIPLGVLVTAPEERLSDEMGVKRTWTKIIAKVTESSNSDIMTGSSFIGRITSEPVTPNVANANLAVRINYDFGGPEQTKTLGFPISMTWQINSDTQTIRSVNVDWGDLKPAYLLR
jgi:hypothetical protein